MFNKEAAAVVERVKKNLDMRAVSLQSSERFSDSTKLQMIEVISRHFKETMQLQEYIEALEQIVISEIDLIGKHFPLGKVERIRLEKDELILTDAQGRDIARFERIKEK